MRNQMSEKNGILGLIAGGGQFPMMVAEFAKKEGLRVIAIAHRGETEPSLSERVDRASLANSAGEVATPLPMLKIPALSTSLHA